MKSNENSDSVRSFGFRAPRVSCNFSFLLDVIATGERQEAMCTDISEDGLAAELPKPLAVKTQVRMTLLLPGGVRPLQIEGRVEYSQDRAAASPSSIRRRKSGGRSGLSLKPSLRGG